jgi:hypothetical protein
MLKSLRVPEKLFTLATWVVSVVFASFLIGLGGKIVGDLPGVDERLSVEQFADSATLQRARVLQDSLARAQVVQEEARDRARLRLTAQANAYRMARASFENWIATRTATTDPSQDPEVVRRTRQLDELKAGERAAQVEMDTLEATVLRTAQALTAQQRAEQESLEDALRSFESALFRHDLQVFAIRLALTLPLLLVAWWLIARKRRSRYWPLARGFVLFALFAFFVELVPYLPSYGGYVRYGVGVIASAIAGVYVIRAMQRYMARRAEAERRSERERRQALDYEAALRQVAAGVCPGCERAIATGPDGKQSNFCGHCGMTLHDSCGACGTRKNAFYQYCPTCGVPTGAPSAEAPAAP